MPELLTGTAFQSLFEDVQRSADRLETRDYYGGDQPEVDAWLRGDIEEIPENDRRAAWLARIRQQTAAGIHWRRVRVVQEPPTDYQRFGLMSCRQNVDAGEDIRYLSHDRALAAGLPTHDFWLFDGQRLALMYFGFDDRLIGAQIITDAQAGAQHRAWFEKALTAATPYRDYLEADPTRTERPGARFG